jgi:hypothetical protein
MSTGCECQFIEVKPNEWWYLLEEYNAPKNSWDWREFAEAYGPFSSEDEAGEHLSKNHANPGGREIQVYQEGFQPDAILTKLMNDARNRDLQYTRRKNY